MVKQAAALSKVIMLHILHKDNPFPSIAEQPDSIRYLFLDKAITFIPGIFP